MGMSRTVKNILTLVICLVVLAGIGVGIYFAYKATEKPRDPDAVAIVVTYDANGGEIETETSSVYKDNNYGTLPVPTRTGYTFDGWYTALENGTKVESSTLVTATEDHTLYANWTAITYNVVLNENGGNNVDDLTYTVETTTLTLPTLTREGYTFNGWFTAEVAGTKVESTDILSKLENQEYYAQWTANQFTVIFDSNKPADATAEVVGTMENQTFTYDALQNLTANTYSLEYYNFAGWSTTANGSVAFTDGQSVKNLAPEGSITLYAVWLADNERVITFEGNGVVVNPSTMIVTVGDAYGALPTLTRAGYTFDGWFTALENGTRVETTTTVPQGANHTLYAHWTINIYNVVLNENGGNNVDDLTYTVETTTLTLPTLTRAGYTFNGWFTAEVAGTKVESTDILSKLGNQEYYAQWTAITYNVVLNENGGNNVDDLTYTVETTTLTLPTLTKANYVFTGWFTAEVGGTKVEATDILSKLGNQEYYAQWTAITYNVVLNENGGNNVDDLTYTVETTTLTLPTLTRAGYTFNGWFTAEVAGTKVEATDILSKLGNQEYYAQWTAITYNVVLNENGGNNVDDLTYTVETTTLTLPTLTKANYVFTGWFTAEVAGTKVEATDILSKLENQEYYAQWTPEVYDVILDENGGDLINDITYTIESEDITLPTPTRDGYTFIGWFGVKVVSGTTYYVGMDFLTTNNNALAYTSLDEANLNDTNKVVVIDCDVFAVNIGSGTLIAKWEITVPPETVEITFNANGGSVNPSTTTLVVGEAYGTLPTPTRSNYTFNGWFTTLTGETKVESTTIVVNDIDHTLYAKWSYSPAVEDLTSNELQTTSGTKVETISDGIIYQIVDPVTKSGYKVSFTTTAMESVSNRYDGGIMNLSGAIVDPDDISGTATITGWTGEPYEILIPEYITVSGKTYKVTGIGAEAFKSCLHIKNVAVSDTVTVIGNSAFKSCTNLQTLTLGNRINNIEWGTFMGCSALQTVELPSNLIAIKAHAFDGCSSLQYITIPDSVTTLGEYAFYDCTSLTNVTIGNGVEIIQTKAFLYCSKIQTVVIGSKVKTIEAEAFSDCHALQNLTFGSAVETIGKSAFANHNLTSLELPKGLKTIGDHAFMASYTNYSTLTDVVIPNTVTSIGASAFVRCSQLKNFTFSSAIEEIGDELFTECFALENIYLADGNNNYVISGNCLIEKSTKTIIFGTKLSNIPSDANMATAIADWAFYCSKIQTVTIPSNIKTIGKSAFQQTSLASLTIEGGVETIGKNAFAFCTLLTTVSLGNGITALSDNMFQGCSALQTLTLPSSITSIGGMALYDCGNLKTLTVQSTTPPTVTSFDLPNSLTRINVPSGYVSVYKAAEGWKEFASIIA